MYFHRSFWNKCDILGVTHGRCAGGGSWRKNRNINIKFVNYSRNVYCHQLQSIAKPGDNALGSIRPPMCLIEFFCLNDLYQSVTPADAVNWLLILLERRSSTRGCRSSRGISDFSVISLQNFTKLTCFNLHSQKQSAHWAVDVFSPSNWISTESWLRWLYTVGWAIFSESVDRCPNFSVKGHQNRTSLWLFFQHPRLLLRHSSRCFCRPVYNYSLWDSLK